MSWLDHISTLRDQLHHLSVRNRQGQEMSADEGFACWRSYARQLKKNNRQLFLIGNGASASMASHFATDIVKNGGIRAKVFTDMSLLTALSNDLCFEEVYATPLRWYGSADDMLVAISSSGDSANIVKAIDQANTMGITTITLSAMAPANRIRNMGTLNFYIPAQTYGDAESGHAAIMHYWMDLLEQDHAHGHLPS